MPVHDSGKKITLLVFTKFGVEGSLPTTELDWKAKSKRGRKIGIRPNTPRKFVGMQKQKQACHKTAP